MRVVQWVLTVGWMGLLVYGSLVRSYPLPIETVVAAVGTVSLHLLSYGMLAALLGLALGLRWSLLVAAALAVAYGALLEVVQLAVPGRTADWADLGFNLAGAVGGALLMALVVRFLPRRRARRG